MEGTEGTVGGGLSRHTGRGDAARAPLPGSGPQFPPPPPPPRADIRPQTLSALVPAVGGWGGGGEGREPGEGRGLLGPLFISKPWKQAKGGAG